MRILQLLSAKSIAGTETFCISLSNELSKSNEVYLMTYDGFKKYISPNVNFVSLDMEAKRWNPFFLYHLYKTIKAINPDIIHIHKKKYIYIINMLKIFLNIPFIASKHDMEYNKRVYKKLKHVISTSQDVTKTLTTKNIYKIYNGIKLKAANSIEMPDAFNIVAVGGLRYVKGYDILIEKLSSVPINWHLTIIGEGDEREALEALADKLDIKNRVSLVGFKDNVQDYLNSADLQIISSRSEAFSLAMIEGLFYSKILISTHVSGCTEVLSDDLLYTYDNLAEKIINVHDNYKKYMDEFQIVKDKHRDNLTIESCASNHIELYKELILKRANL